MQTCDKDEIMKFVDEINQSGMVRSNAQLVVKGRELSMVIRGEDASRYSTSTCELYFCTVLQRIALRRSCLVVLSRCSASPCRAEQCRAARAAQCRDMLSRAAS